MGTKNSISLDMIKIIEELKKVTERVENINRIESEISDMVDSLNIDSSAVEFKYIGAGEIIIKPKPIPPIPIEVDIKLK